MDQNEHRTKNICYPSCYGDIVSLSIWNEIIQQWEDVQRHLW
jgi:hypothetical protein